METASARRPVPRRAVLGAAVAVLLATAVAATATPPRAELLVARERVVTAHTGGVPSVVHLVNRGGPVAVEARRVPGTGDWVREQIVAGVRSPLPATVPAGPRGLGRAVTVTVLDAGRRVVRRRALDVCLNASPQRLGPSGPAQSGFPQGCLTHPFATGLRMGLDTDHGVAIDLWRVTGSGLARGRYTVRVRMRPATADWLGMAPGDRAATIALRVLPPPRPTPWSPGDGEGLHDGPIGEGVTGAGPGPRHAHPPRYRPVRRTTPPVTDVVPPADALPNLVALPATDVTVTRQRRRDLLEFSATVWNAGPGTLIVEGYRRGTAPRMDAWQFFRRGDDDVAAVPVGVLDYDPRTAHDHWHFRDFARYSLTRADGRRAAVSPKEAWCLVPTDQIDQLVPNADLLTGDTSLVSACGDADAVQVREVLEVGAGDTYGNGTPGQAIDVTRLPNGSYLLRIEGNPAGALRETTTTDNLALRRIELGGRPGARTVRVPPAEGIDTERGRRTPAR